MICIGSNYDQLSPIDVIFDLFHQGTWQTMIICKWLLLWKEN